MPRISSSGRIGVTMSCSIVPISFSRTIESAVSMVVRICRMNPMSAGTMKFAETMSGLYHTRGLTSNPSCV